ncbi:MAG: hypothetical protein LBO00_00555 [Zoogloeaceae bacterium]|jgi:hypothetical protein|nr:hypothetical protein [Zoogloeaceae bacterium]
MSRWAQELLQQTRFAAANELETTLTRYLAAYNHDFQYRLPLSVASSVT